MGPVMPERLSGQRVVVTQADAFMGPAICNLFREEGAVVVADTTDLRPLSAAASLISSNSSIDILVANLMRPNPRHSAIETSDEEWEAMFDDMVHPLHRLVRAVLPQMIARRRGKIVVIGSANGLRGTSVRAAYSAARGAQLAYVKNVGIEVASYGVNVNAIAQNYVSNPTSYTTEKLATPEVQDALRQVPAGRPAEGWESAALALMLASADSDFFYGQVFPFAGGWVT